MKRDKVRETSVEPPVLSCDLEPAQVQSLSAERGTLTTFELAGSPMRALDVKNVHLVDGRVRALRAETAVERGLTARSVDFAGCELGSLRWAGGKLTRVRFDGCKLLGARFENVTLDHVVFSDCKLDYAAFSQVRTVGPVLFVRCSLREAEFHGCDLTRSLFEDCDLGLADFGAGAYRGCDLRGNDLSSVSGAQHLRRVVIDRAQLLQLAEALAAELEVSFGDDA